MEIFLYALQRVYNVPDTLALTQTERKSTHTRASAHTLKVRTQAHPNAVYDDDGKI